MKSTEGTVTSIDRRKKEITIRYNNGKTETPPAVGIVSSGACAGTRVEMMVVKV